ncbi:MAG: ribbon-helix-helix protein, CopG family [Elusimicrobia bacterium]|nr:ribbon-helix-helix protein, CopG family [Elusimicrobiota bacterium]
MKKDILAVRLGARESRLLDELQEKLKVTRSELVREAIVRYAAQTRREETMTAAERLAPIIGSISSDTLPHGRDIKRRFKEEMLKKYGNRSR